MQRKSFGGGALPTSWGSLQWPDPLAGLRGRKKRREKGRGTKERGRKRRKGERGRERGREGEVAPMHGDFLKSAHMTEEVTQCWHASYVCYYRRSSSRLKRQCQNLVSQSGDFEVTPSADWESVKPVHEVLNRRSM